MNEELKYWVWLSSLPDITPRRRILLLEHFGSPKNLWEASEKDLQEVSQIPKLCIYRILDKNLRERSGKYLDKLKGNKIRTITINDRSYPDILKSIYDPPAVLYVKGKFYNNEKAIAVVGSRNATRYGLNMAEKLSYELAKCGLTVISGMARGIDSQAHCGALKAGGRTVAVLGCGLDTVYPSENEDLAKRILVSGAIVSEYLPGMPPFSYNFPLRNRIISGLSLGVVVIEANEKSGSLITANLALEQGREVFAVPGNINNANSIGTNGLIKDGAKMVTSIEDILEELDVSFETGKTVLALPENAAADYKFRGLECDEMTIVRVLQRGMLHVDLLSNYSGLSVQMVNAILVSLELKGLVEQLPGKIFKLKE